MNLDNVNLWGQSFELEDNVKKTKLLLNKIKSPKTEEISTEKQLKSKKISLQEKLEIINKEVKRILGKYIDETIVITSREELHKYIEKCIINKNIEIDTETNNSLNPITCQLMGLCLYTPGMKQAYVPINHTDLQGNRLPYQLTEKDIKEELQNIIDYKTMTVYHNGKFDYQVLKCQSGIELNIDWDTMICAKLLNENEPAGLKFQYIDKIDKSQEKYSITHLFANVEYKYVDPKIFALYAATDPSMTYKLYKWQEEVLKDKSLSNLKDLFLNVEMPIVKVVAEMELTGIELDLEYSKRLLTKYTKMYENYQHKIDEEYTNKYKSKVDAWRLTKEALEKSKKEITKDTYLKSVVKNPKDYIKEGNKYYKLGKSKAEQLDEKINYESPTQLAIFLYDVLKCNAVNKKTPRSVDKKALPLLAKENNLEILNLLLEQKAINTLLNDFIIKLPKLVGSDNRIHCSFNQLGSEENNVVTGRMSSSDPNLQQIPSHNKEIRMMFQAQSGETFNEIKNNYYELSKFDEIEVDKYVWKLVKNLKIGDKILTNENTYDTIIDIVEKDNKLIIKVK